MADDPAPPLSKTAARVSKLNYRSWLWLQHNESTKYAQLARLVLSGGPENVWVNKPIKAEVVCHEIESFYASKRDGITKEHVELARSAIDDFKTSEDTVDELISDREIKDREAKKSVESAMVVMAEREMESEEDRRVITSAHGSLSVGEAGIVRTTCDFINTKNGRACARVAVLGQARCDLHGGMYLEPEEIKSILMRGQEKLVAASSAAIDAALDVMQNSVNDAVRLKAAEMIMDRAGYRPGMEITVAQGGGDGVIQSAGEQILAKLAQLGSHGDGNVVTQEGDQVA